MKFRTFTGKAKAFSFAIAVHAIFIAVVLLNFDWSPEEAPPLPVPSRQEKEPIQASVIDETRVQAELAEIAARRQKAMEDEKARVQKLEHQAKIARERRKKEEEKLADIQRRLKEQERRRKEAEKEAERKRQEKEKAKKERQRKAKEKAAREKAAARKKAEAERRRKAAEQALRDKLAAEQAERERKRQRRLNRYRLEYISRIKSSVEHNWIRPPGTAKGLSCKLKVTQTPNGDVMDVSITVGSGIAAFDRSAVAAVFKASPLPRPRDPDVFDRNIVLTLLNPED